MKNLRQRLKEDSQFTYTEKRIADFVLNHGHLISSLSLDELAAKVYTSHSSIIRFSQKLGYEGYREFRFALTTAYQEERFQEGSVDANVPFLESDSCQEVAKKMADLTMTTIQTTYRMLDYSALETSVLFLSAAKRVFIFAKGDSQIRARAFQNKLVKLGLFIVLAEEYADEAWVVHNIHPGDLAIFISYSARTKQYESFIHELSSNQVPTIVITSDSDSILAQHSSALLLTDNEESYTDKVGTFSSQIAIEYILDVLYSLFYKENYQENKALLSKKYHNIEKGDLND